MGVRLTPREHEQLSWVLDFVEKDLNPTIKVDEGEFDEPLPVLEKLNIQNGLRSFIGRYKPGQGTDWSDEGQIKELTDSITPKEWEKTTKIQQKMRDLLAKVVGAKGDKPPAPVLSLPSAEVNLHVDGDEIRVEHHYKSDEHVAIYNLVHLLSLIPRSSIRRCEGCGRYFFNPTQRNKHFCTVHCTWRHSAKLKREADREGYRKKQKGVMREWRKGKKRKKDKKK